MSLWWKETAQPDFFFGMVGTRIVFRLSVEQGLHERRPTWYLKSEIPPDKITGYPQSAHGSRKTAEVEAEQQIRSFIIEYLGD